MLFPNALIYQNHSKQVSYLWTLEAEAQDVENREMQETRLDESEERRRGEGKSTRRWTYNEE